DGRGRILIPLDLIPGGDGGGIEATHRDVARLVPSDIGGYDHVGSRVELAGNPDVADGAGPGSGGTGGSVRVDENVGGIEEKQSALARHRCEIHLAIDLQGAFPGNL